MFWHRHFRTVCRVNVPIAVVAVAMADCASGPQAERAVYQSPAGAVVLERVSDRAFQATHPLALDQALVSKILTGLRIQEGGGILEPLFPSTPATARAFSDAEVAFLTPHITAALAQAGPRERIGFRFNSTPEIPTLSQSVGAAVGSSEPPLTGQIVETTRGYLYAHGRSLHLTLTEYRHRPERADTINMANRRMPDLTGLGRRNLTFSPDTALRPDSYKQPELFDDPDAKTVVLDYQLVAKLPAAPSEPARPTAPPVPPSTQSSTSPVAQPAAPPSKQESAGKSDVDLQSLKDELKALQKKVDEQNAELQKLKQVPKKKPAAP